MREIKLFFKWLHASMTHLNDESTAIDIIRFNEEMENSILDFIQSTFKDAQSINLEKVGQYLKIENLKTPIREENSWQTFLKTKLTQGDSSHFYLNKREKSLLGCFDEFKQSLNMCFRTQAIKNKQPLSIVRQYNIHKFNSAKDANEMVISFKCMQNHMMTGLLMAKTNNECYILKHLINNYLSYFGIEINNHETLLKSYLQDVYIYGENNVTLMGAERNNSNNTYLAQLSLQSTPIGILNDLIEVKNYTNENNQTQSKSSTSNNSSNNRETNLLMIKAEKLSANSIIKCIKRFKSAGFCVSSSRKVLALLSSNRHRVKLFELEVDDEDDNQDNEEVENTEVDDQDQDDEKNENDEADADENNQDEIRQVKSRAIKTEEYCKSTEINSTNDQEMINQCDYLNNTNNRTNFNSQNILELEQDFEEPSSNMNMNIGAHSVCSSTAATIGSTVNNSMMTSFESSSSNSLASNYSRVKRKINENEDDDSNQQQNNNNLF